MTEREEELNTWLTRQCERLGIPGAVLGVVQDGGEHIACHGVTSTTDPLPVDETTLFMIGSTTKTLTATALMTFVDRGVLTLDDRVVDHLPDLELADRAARDEVTVGHLVDHTAGWVGDAMTDTGWGDDALARAIPQLVGGREQLTRPGTVASYNNAAFVLAGHLVAVLAGETYEQAVRRLVLEPLGMADTWFLPWEVANRRLAVGHAIGPDGPRPELEWPLSRAIGPAGTAMSTVADQLRYLRFHLDGTAATSPPITDRARESMQRQRASMGSGIDGIGVAWLLRDHGGQRVVEHGGNVSNLQVSSFAMAPDHGLGVTTLANGAGGRALGSAALDFVLERFAGWTPPPQPAPLALDDDRVAEYVGVYAAGQWDLVVEHTDGDLTVRMRITDVEEEMSDEVRASFEKPQPVAVVATDVIAPRDERHRTAGDFVRDDTGAVRFLRYGLRLARRVE